MNERARPPLADRLKAGMEETLAWARGDGESRVTIVDAEGRREGPELLTARETLERVAERPEKATTLAYVVVFERGDHN